METRRGFFQRVLAGLAAAAVALRAGSASAAKKKLAISLDKAPQLKQVGGSVTLKLMERQILFIRDSATTVRALGALCTHQRCLVTYDGSAKKIACACHNSHFDMTGKVQSGPAPKALPCYPAELSGDRVVIEVE